MSWYGRLCVLELDRLEADAAFWTRYTARLHPDEIHAIVNDEIGIIKRPLEPTWPVGEWMKLASNYWIKPEPATFTRRGWRIAFAVRDFRVRFAKHVPSAFEPPELDDFGEPVPTDLESIEEARLDGNYTAAVTLAVPDSCEIDLFTEKRLAREATERREADLMDTMAAMEEVRLALDRVVEERPHMASVIGRELWAVRGRIEAVKRKLKRYRVAV